MGSIDWVSVANANGCSKEAAYMRYNRLVGALKKANGQTPTNTPKKTPSKSRKRANDEDLDSAAFDGSPKKKVAREKTVKKEEPIEESFDDLFPSIKREL